LAYPPAVPIDQYRRNSPDDVSKDCGHHVAIASPSISRASVRLTALYEEHAASVFRFALHLTGRREDAEDVVQFVFIRAYERLQSGKELTHERAWLMQVTKNRSLNVVRDRRELPTAEVRVARTETAYDAQEAEALAAIRAVLWSLPENQHHAFVLRHWSGLSQSDIAEVLATTPSAVESLLTRARSALVEESAATDPECRQVRTRLVNALGLAPTHSAHLEACRKCRTARQRLTQAAGFATTLGLMPRPHVAHALASTIPGFAPQAVGASGLGATGTGAAAGGTGAGAGAAPTSSVLAASGSTVTQVATAAKVTMAAKIVIATVTATAALAAVHPVRQPVTQALDTLAATVSPGHSRPASPGSGGNGHGAKGGSSNSAGHANGQANSHSQNAAAKGKGKGHSGPPGKANGQANGKANGKADGNNGKSGASHGKAVGKTASPGATKKANSTTGGASAKTNNGKSTTSKGSSTAKSKAGTNPNSNKPPKTTTTTGAGNGNGNGNGNGKGNGKS
jgi:RNA polymerase sigma-70 factor, ECF subfamily